MVTAVNLLEGGLGQRELELLLRGSGHLSAPSSRSSIVNVPGESTLRRDFLRLQQENKERSEALRRQQLLQEQQLREQEEYKRQLLAERQKRIEQQKEQRRRLEEVEKGHVQVGFSFFIHIGRWTLRGRCLQLPRLQPGKLCHHGTQAFTFLVKTPGACPAAAHTVPAGRVTARTGSERPLPGVRLSLHLISSRCWPLGSSLHVHIFSET